MELIPVVKGVASYVPGFYTWRSRRRARLTANADYCYRTWLSHLVPLTESGGLQVPKTIAELGPGSSLGLGLAALLSGADTYYALDILKYSEDELSLVLLDELIELFRRRQPARIGWTSDSPVLFPGNLLTEELLESTLAEPRIEQIRRAIVAPTGNSGSITIQYTVPWNDPSVIRRGEVDLIVSTSVLEHVDDLAGTYDAFKQWLKPGGRMSHSIDFRSHFETKTWNSHWEYPEPIWKLVVGKKPYLINRQPCSTHLSMMTERGFEIDLEQRQTMKGTPRQHLASRWRAMSDDDLKCAEVLVQARLP